MEHAFKIHININAVSSSTVPGLIFLSYFHGTGDLTYYVSNHGAVPTHSAPYKADKIRGSVGVAAVV